LKSLAETGQPPSLVAALKEGSNTWGAFLTTTWSMTWRATLGMILFIVPGVVLMIRYALALPVTAFEGLDGPAALERSGELVKGRAGKLVLYVLGVGLLLFFVMGIPGLFSGEHPGVALDAITSIPSNVAVVGVTVALALFYVDVARPRAEHRPVRAPRPEDGPSPSGRGAVVISALAVFWALVALVVSTALGETP
ncbi:MAG TPA: glycerophosphoryl diester phosphodiesterase membrane domain-containing protein, partial [Polyangiaceae bacterium]|nr:glycerophosphoryl diester phosphodiesterase membrane domain-containing protein [Polyangiaceae bacterium]